MGKQKQVEPTRDPQTLPITANKGDTMPVAKARAATKASINAVMVVNAFQGNIMGNDVDLGALVTDMQTRFTEVNDGDLSTLEAMLVGQATALQTMFTSLAMKAANQEYLKNQQLFMMLALKAQAQSRATISALVDLKYPKQAATFVKQANISNGHQQVNNGAALKQTTHARETQTQQNELLEDQLNGGTQLDPTTTSTAARSHQEVEAVGTVHRAKKQRG